jgi:hypothetical protein
LASDFESSDTDASVPAWQASQTYAENARHQLSLLPRAAHLVAYARKPLSHESLRDVVQIPDAACQWDVPCLSVNADGEHMLPSTFDPTLLYSTLVLALR